MLTYAERKTRMPHGGVSDVAARLGFAVSNVSGVLKGATRNRAIERALAALMKPKTTVSEAFGVAGPERMRRVRALATTGAAE